MSISEGELIGFWGDSLTLIPSELVRPFALPDSTFDFLTKIGLPLSSQSIKDDLNLEFVKDVHAIHLITFQSINYVVIGGIPDVDIVTGIRQTDGSIYNLYPPTGGYDAATLELSSSIQNYLAFLQLFLTIRPFPWEQSDEEVVKRVANLMQAFKEIDPNIEIDPDKASGHDSYWAWVFADYLDQADSG
jgi:hypothetical protein